MDQIKKYLKTVLKILVGFTVPLMIALIIIYELIFSIGGDWIWSKLIIYSLIISFVSVPKYKQTAVEIPIEDKNNFKASLKEKLNNRPWQLTREDSEKFIVRPEFDWPYSWIHKERVSITIVEGYVQLKGAKTYVDKIKAIINNQESIWEKKIGRCLGKLLLACILSIPILINSGIIYTMQSNYHEIKVRNIEKINLKENDILGNSVNNMNNHGGAAENEEYVFYVKNHLTLCRSDKNFRDEIYLIDKPSGTGINRLNVIDDWIFYSSGKSFNRMKIDGTKNETIYNLGYIFDIHILNNWIYFINHSDNSKIYKMDVNGQNLHKINDVPVRNIAIYENRIYYSYEIDGEGFLESMDLNGQEKQLVANILADSLVKDNDIIYYTNYIDFKLYKYNVKKNRQSKVLIDDKISSFLIVDNWIYFSKKPEDVGYPGTGLYKIDINGKNKTKIIDDTRIEHLSSIGDWILFSSSKDNKYPSLKRMNIEDNTIIQMK